MLQENLTQIGKIEQQLRQIYWLVNDDNADRIFDKLDGILEFEEANGDTVDLSDEQVLAEFCDNYPVGHEK